MISTLASFAGYRISRIDNVQYFNFESLLYYYLSLKHSIRFVQIGGCDGSSFDPLYPVLKRKPHNFTGVIIEPVQDYHRELEDRYKHHSNIDTAQFAIHNSKDEAILYRPDPEIIHTLPSFAKGVVSFDKSQIEKFGLSSEHIVTEKVPCKSLYDVIEEYEMSDLDLLVIDTEGYDAEILLNHDFENIKPSIIYFEHGRRENLMSREQFEKVIQKLDFHQYEIIFEDFDATAIHREFFLSITK